MYVEVGKACMNFKLGVHAQTKQSTTSDKHSKTEGQGSRPKGQHIQQLNLMQ